MLLTHTKKDPYIENYNTIMKKLKKTQKNGKIFCVHELGKAMLLKCPYYPKQSVNSVQS